MIRKFIRSVGYGCAGLAHALGTEQNLRIDAAVAVGVVAAGGFFKLAAGEWIAVTFCIGLMISAECMNTAIERLCDRVSLEKNLLIKQAKDCSAAAVLALAVMSAVVGGIIFVPKLAAWLGW